MPPAQLRIPPAGPSGPAIAVVENSAESRRPRYRALLASLLLSALAVGSLGCASGAGGGSGGVGSSLGQLFAPTPDGPDAWRLPEQVYPSQRLYRVHYQGPEGKLGFRLTLYLGGPHHYRMDAADTLGRRVFSLALEPDDRAIWVDHRQKRFCRTLGATEQAFVPIAYLPLEALPRLILGRMPARPSGEVQKGEGKIAYHDDQGQLWNGVEKDGQLSWWSLLREGEAVAWWRRNGDENIFSDRRGGQQVRWSEQVRESLAEPLQAMEVPSAYREGVCGSAVDRKAP